MATVLLARDTGLKRLVAVKALRAELSEDPICCKRFEREAQTAARLSHANIPAIHAVGRLADDTPYIEMQHVQGKSLEALAKSRGQLGIDESLAILEQIAAALQAAHQSNVIHRDVKPANILVDDDGKVWLCDFGVAAVIETGAEALTRLTRAGERFGDPRYLSPEQIRGETLSPQSDVYSLAVVAFELICGHGPFDNEEIRDVANAHLRRPPPKLDAIDPNAPAWLSALLHRCLAKSAEHRPSAGDVLAALQSPSDSLAPDSEQQQHGDQGAINRFLAELKTRKVYQAAAAYAAAVFLILQVADLTLPVFAAGNLYNALVIGLLLGFPIVVALAWIYDWHQGRLVKTADSGIAQTSDRLLKRTGLLLCVAASLAVASWLVAT